MMSAENSKEVLAGPARGIIAVRAVHLWRVAHREGSVSMNNKFERRTWLLFGKIPLFSSEKVLEAELFVNAIAIRS